MKSWTAFASPVVAALGITLALVGVGLASAGVLPPLAGFGLFALGILGGSLLGILLGLVGLIRTRGDSERTGAGRAGMGVVLGLLMIGFLMLVRPDSVPPIHDITTSPDDPPSFVSLAAVPDNAERDLSYPHGPEDSAMQQRSAYPELSPIELSEPPAEALDAARTAAEELGWEVVDEAPPTETTDGRLEATFTSRSFRFVDDIVVRLRANPDTGGTTVDLRSTSRVGQSDLGANAARIRAFAEKLGA